MVSAPRISCNAFRVVFALLLIVTMTVIGGCAATAATSDTSKTESRLGGLAQQQQAELTSYAALLRVKMLHEGRIDDFRAEIFADGDSLLSIYVRGFLGKSAFKALLHGDSLLIYFPSERKYFSGWRHDIETGELRDTRYIVDYLFTLLQGHVVLPDSGNWSNQIIEKNDRIQLMADDHERHCDLRVDLSIDRQKFPYQELKSLELRSVSGKLRINVQVQSSYYNRQIPVEKYGIDLPPTAIQLSKDDLVAMLTGVTP
jgi:hypothetical protein